MESKSTPISHAVTPPAVVAVTGASGFVGSHVVRELLRRGYRVRGTVRDPTDEAKTAHLRAMAGAGERLELFPADLMEPNSFDAALAGVEGVVHCAAQVHQRRQAKEMISSHTDGTRNVVASAMASPTVRRFVITSSEAAVASPFKGRPGAEVRFTEEDWSDDCTPGVGGFYATGKRDAERLVHSAASKVGVRFDAVSVCPSVVIGESLCKAHTKASPVFIRELIFGNEQEDVHFNYVDATDVAAAHCEALVREDASEAPGRYLVSSELSGRPGDICARLAGLYPGLVFEARHPSCLKSSFRNLFLTKYESQALSMQYALSTARSREYLGLEYTPVEITLRRTVDSMVESGFVKPCRRPAQRMAEP